MTKPLSLRAFAKFWIAECEWERLHAHAIVIWEPLNIDAPEDARPSCCYGNTVIFYDRAGNQRLGDCRHHEIGFPEHLLYVEGTGRWWEVGGLATCTWRKGGWYMRWTAWDNTRRAEFANLGWRAWDCPRWTSWGAWPRIVHWGGWHTWKCGAIYWRGAPVWEWGERGRI